MNLRPPTLDDVPVIAGFLNRMSQAREGMDSSSEEEVRLWLTSPTNDPQKNVRLAFDARGLVGYADVDPRGSAPIRWWSEIEVDPTADVTSVGAALVPWAEQRAREEQPAVLAPYVSSANATVKRLLEERDFRLIRHSYRMEIDLDDRRDEPEWPDGIELHTMRAGEERRVWEAQEEIFEDSWAHTPTPYEEWLHWMRNKPSFDPTLWFLALDGDELAAICLCRPHPREADLGWVDILGTRRRWRRQGLGRALLLHSFGVFRERGFPRVGLGVDATSLTGANRLYERAGMRVVRQWDFYEKQLWSRSRGR